MRRPADQCLNCAPVSVETALWGSDMPVLEAGGGHSVEAAFAVVDQAPDPARRQKDALLGGTARRIFFQTICGR